MKLKKLQLLILLLLTQLITTHHIRAQICDDWKSQSTSYVITGTTPNDPDFYTWSEKGNLMQGVHLCVLNAEVIPVYIQQNNNYINFTSRFGPSAAMLYMVQLEVNVNDAGYVEIYHGSSKMDIVWYGSSGSYPNLGDYNLKVRVVFSDGSITFREYKIKVIPSSQELHKDNVGNTLRKWSGNNFNGLNAIVFSEGFDAYNTNGQEMYYHAAADLVECFNENGYDVFLLDNYFGTQNIKHNSAVFASAVKYISSQYGEELIVAGGVSMGGIISRYAMAKAESEGDPLPVHTFIAIDSPHQGAVVSEPLQNFKRDNEGDDEFAQQALNNAAAKQLLAYNAYDPDGTVHDNFYQELNSINGDGYSHFTRNIGVSFSTNEPNPNTGGWYKITYHLGPMSGTVKTIDLTAAEMQAGSWLPKDLTTMSPIIKQASYWWLQLLVPGITPLYYPTIEFERFTDPTYIPYYSALDIRNGQSMFDVSIEPESSSYHDVLPPDILEEIVNEVILTDEFLQDVYVIGLWNMRGRKVVTGNYVTTLISQGDVILRPGGNLNINASEVISLRDGFHAEYGSEMHLIVDPDLYYECSGSAKQLSGPTPEAAQLRKIISNQKLIQDNDLLVFPNPASERLQIKVPEGMTGPWVTEIFSMYNVSVMKQTSAIEYPLNIDISKLTKGTYVIKVSNSKFSYTQMFVKL